MRPQPQDRMRDWRGSGKLDGKTALVTGGDSGIGRAVAIGFAKEGADVAILYKEEHQDAEETKRLIEAEGRRVYYPGDTDAIPEMDRIRADIVLMPVGGTYTMTAAEAADAVNRMKPVVAVPIHWGDIVGSEADAKKFKEYSMVPVEIKPNRQLALALRWLTQYAAGRRGVGMPKAVALELLDAYNNQGNIIKKRDDTHKMAQANKAFAHYAW